MSNQTYRAPSAKTGQSSKIAKQVSQRAGIFLSEKEMATMKRAVTNLFEARSQQRGRERNNARDAKHAFTHNGAVASSMLHTTRALSNVSGAAERFSDPQLHESLRKLLESGTNAANLSTETINAATSTCDRIGATAEDASSLITHLQTLIQGIAAGDAITKGKSGLATIAEAVKRAAESTEQMTGLVRKILLALAAAVAMILLARGRPTTAQQSGFIAFIGVLAFAEPIERAIKKLVDVLIDLTDGLTHNSASDSRVKTLLEAIATLIGSIGGVFSVTGARVKEVMTGALLFGKTVTVISLLAGLAGKLLFWLKTDNSFLRDYVDRSALMAEVDAWCQTALEHITSGAAIRVLKEPTYARVVKEHTVAGDALELRLLAVADLPEMRAKMLLWKRVRDLMNIALDAANRILLPKTLRAEPTCAFIVGKPGVGKSSLIPIMHGELMDMLEPGVEHDGTLCLYRRNFKEDFWSGFHHQSGILFDDVFQLKKPESLDDTLSSLIDVVNTAEYNCNMPNLHEKGVTKVVSNYLYITSNEDLRHEARAYAMRVLDWGAIKRRLHYVIEVSVLPEFQRGVGNQPQMLDIEKATAAFGGKINKGVYVFRIRLEGGASDNTRRQVWEQFGEEPTDPEGTTFSWDEVKQILYKDQKRRLRNHQRMLEEVRARKPLPPTVLRDVELTERDTGEKEIITVEFHSNQDVFVELWKDARYDLTHEESAAEVWKQLHASGARPAEEAAMATARELMGTLCEVEPESAGQVLLRLAQHIGKMCERLGLKGALQFCKEKATASMDFVKRRYRTSHAAVKTVWSIIDRARKTAVTTVSPILTYLFELLTSYWWLPAGLGILAYLWRRPEQHSEVQRHQVVCSGSHEFEMSELENEDAHDFWFYRQDVAWPTCCIEAAETRISSMCVAMPRPPGGYAWTRQNISENEAVFGCSVNLQFNGENVSADGMRDQERRVRPFGPGNRQQGRHGRATKDRNFYHQSVAVDLDNAPTIRFWGNSISRPARAEVSMNSRSLDFRELHSTVLAHHPHLEKIADNCGVLTALILLPNGKCRSAGIRGYFTHKNFFHTNKHFFKDLAAEGVKVRFVLATKRGNVTFGPEKLVLHWRKDSDISVIDLAPIAKHLGEFADIRHYTAGDILDNFNPSGQYFFITVLTLTGDKIVDATVSTRMVYPATGCSFIRPRYAGTVGSDYQDLAISATGFSGLGACGSPVVWINGFGEAKVMGLLNASYNGTSMMSYTTLTFLPYNIRNWLDHPEVQIQPLTESVIFSPPRLGQIVHNSEGGFFDDPRVDAACAYFAPFANTVSLARVPVEHQVRVAYQTKLEPTIWGGLWENEKVPGVLKPSNAHPSPLAEMASAGCECIANFPVTYGDKQWARNVLEAYSVIPAADRKVLSLSEAINGLRFGNGIAELERTRLDTSPGWPYISYGGRKNWKDRGGKKTFIDDENGVYEMNRDGRAEYMRIKSEVLAKRKIYWVDTLKDELRPVGKEHKPRVFNNGNMFVNLMLKQYYGAVLADTCAGSKLKSPIVYGIDVTNRHEWTSLYEHLVAGRDVVWFAADFSKFDKKIPLSVLNLVFDVLDGYYERTADEDDRRMREGLRHQVCHAWHLCGKYEYQLHWGNPSGNTLTTLINCWANVIMHRAAFRGCGLSDSMFDNDVRMAVYGDDSIIAVPRWFVTPDSEFDVPAPITQLQLAKWFREHGVMYQSPNKGESLDEFFEIGEFTFLGRIFKWDDQGGFFAALPPESIKSMVQWMMKSRDPHTVQTSIAHAAQAEATLWGPSFFRSLTESLASVPEARNIELLTYEAARDRLEGKYRECFVETEAEVLYHNRLAPRDEFELEPERVEQIFGDLPIGDDEEEAAAPEEVFLPFPAPTALEYHLLAEMNAREWERERQRQLWNLLSMVLGFFSAVILLMQLWLQRGDTG